MKSSIVGIGLLALVFLFFVPSVHADLVCVQSANPADGIVVYKMSATTNAHVELYTQSNYTFEVRCRETSGVTLNNGSANFVDLFKISSVTNAHAEQADQTFYSIPIRLGHNGPASGEIKVEVVSSTAPGACSTLNTPNAVYTEVVRLNKTTNAHAQSPIYPGPNPIYNVRICAAYEDTGGLGPPDEDVVELVLQPAGSNIPPSGTTNLTINVNKLPTDIGYTNTRTAVIASICNKSNAQCNTATPNPAAYNAALAASPAVFTFQELYNYGSYTGGPINSNDATPTAKGALETFPGSTDTLTYAINPGTMGLVAGQNYRFQVIALQAQYNYNAFTNQLETVTYYLDNFAYLDFQISTIPSEDILLVTGPASIVDVSEASTQIVSVDTQNLTTISPNAANYSNLTTLQVIAICNTSVGLCNALQGNNPGHYDQVFTEVRDLATGAGWKFLNPNTYKITEYCPLPSCAYTPLKNLLAGQVGSSAVIQTQGTWMTQPNYGETYTISPSAMGLLPGDYKLVVVDLLGRYDYLATPQFEGTGFKLNNLDVIPFTIIPGGGPSGEGTGGDVYLLRKIEFPSVYKGDDIDIVITAENLKYNDPNKNTNYPNVDEVGFSILIRDSKGQVVVPYNPLVLPAGTFTFDAYSNSFSYTLEIAGNTVFTEGESYTAYVTMLPYVDSNPTFPDYGESFTTNNTGFAAFTVVKKPQGISVPDTPWEFGFGVLGIMLGFMYLASRKVRMQKKH